MEPAAAAPGLRPGAADGGRRHAVPPQPDIRPARLHGLHGPARLHQRHRPRRPGDGDQRARRAGQPGSQLFLHRRPVRPAAPGPGRYRPGHRPRHELHAAAAGPVYPPAAGLCRVLAAARTGTAAAGDGRGDTAPGAAHRWHLRGGVGDVHGRHPVHGHHRRSRPGRAPDRHPGGIRGVHGAGGVVVRHHLPHRPAFRCRPPARSTPRRACRHRLRRAVHAALRRALLVDAGGHHRPVPRPRRPGQPGGGRDGRLAAGDRRLVRAVRRHPERRHGRDPRSQGRPHHLPGRPGLLLAGRRAAGLPAGVRGRLGRRGRLVGAGRRPGLRGHWPDPGLEWKTARLLPKATASEASALNCRAAGRGAPSARRCPGNAPVPPTAAAD
ncbi:multidrug efflux protein NorA [Pseudomonas aeruginosa PA38182]|nr:multidrug efflux protein NorA [Pseudomonas aeruginosa PA38182]